RSYVVHMRAYDRSPFGHVATAELVDGVSAIGVTLAGVDRRPRRPVYDHIRPGRRDGLQHRVAVGQVDIGVGEGDNIVVAVDPNEVAPELTAGAGDERLHGRVTPRS